MGTFFRERTQTAKKTANNPLLRFDKRPRNFDSDRKVSLEQAY
jgi:hypothetical protein